MTIVLNFCRFCRVWFSGFGEYGWYLVGEYGFVAVVVCLVRFAWYGKYGGVVCLNGAYGLPVSIVKGRYG